jgi:GNAT superfamily N-acetyltransferase
LIDLISDLEMSLNYNIRSYKPGEDKKLVELLDAVFHGWPHFDLTCSPLDHWVWKYRDNPGGAGWASVAEIDGDFIGCFHLYDNRIKVGPRVFLGMQSADTGVLSEYQGQGIYTKLYSMMDTLYDTSGVGLHYGVSTNPAVHKTVKKLSPNKYEYPLSVLVRINDINSYIKSYKFSKKVWIWSGFYASKLLNYFNNFFRAPSHKSDGELKTGEIEKFDERIDEFWDKIKNDYDFITVVNREYLNWRYCDPRGGEYKVRYAEEGGEIVGFIVLRVNSFGKDPPLGYVVSLYTLPGRLDCAEVLLDDAIKFFDQRKITLIKYCISRGYFYDSLFRKKGFLDSQSGLFFTIRDKNLGDSFDVFKNSPPERVLFQYGEIDWI